MAQLMAACLADAGAERDHLAAILPGGGADWIPPRCGNLGCDVLAWARSGLMHLTGLPDEAPLAPAAPVLSRVSVLASAITAMTAAAGTEVLLDVPHLLAGRSRLQGWHRRGRISANGSCRLLQAADGWLAVNLARPDDVRSVPAVLGAPVPGDAWTALTEHAGTRPAAEVAGAAQLVGIPAAVLGSSAATEPVRVSRLGSAGARGAPLVLDLSAMWAGPVCARILRQAGWQVLKVEDVRRPDGARSGPPEFYAELHAGIPTVRLDFSSADGRAELRRLAGQAAVVIESSRPRALRNLGLLAEEWLAAAAGRVWVSITGYGRADPQQRVAFGDDAAVAGGLIARTADGSPVFCGDAIADPLTGILSGAAALAAAADGGGALLDVAMSGVCADLAREPAAPLHTHTVEPATGGTGWVARHGDETAAVLRW
ncbi:MAG TPA: CoA transferase [Streptosporangiaceae bacterium]|nr:CoA transferase [Streptosporangiaceae bacterium]